MSDWMPHVELPNSCGTLEIMAPRGTAEKFAMSIVTKIYCDECGKGLTPAEHGAGWRVILANQYIQTPPGCAISDVARAPHVTDGPKHFCDALCLRAWVLAHVSDKERFPPRFTTR